ncbi:MAG: 4Fe-4S binding protein [Dethiobacter sp.]|nr:4Fe-4S binding protein [Dethiobacter sp.]MBS3899843.1 4Fe-4S binding protein [Dethiobacter sp.]MBS3983641.1 4Fe-4S binding protein [Dethiobacter sp.]MCL4463915.1 4Fe-4S binding protein [Bacillota bacterium]MCL5994080.1 4Fe-4S binding protein [Bacillota bacterium]
MSLFGDALLRYLNRALDKGNIPEDASCLVRLYPSFPCHACRDGCPQHAIGTDFKKDHRLCQGCGLCAANCPMAAIDHPVDIFALFGAMRRQRAKEERLRLACQATERETYPGTVTVPCLASLEPAALILPALLNFHQVWLHHGDCSICKLDREARLAGRLNHNFAQATLLASFVTGFGLTLSPSPPAEFTNCREQQSGYSRRDFLTLMRQESKRTAQSGAVLLGNLFWEEKNTLPPRRRLWEKLLALFPGMLKAGEPLPFARLEISSACDFCRACTVLCPTKALVVEEGEDGISLSHQVSLCLSCGACARFCPHKAVSLSPWDGRERQKFTLSQVVQAHTAPELLQEQSKESWSAR